MSQNIQNAGIIKLRSSIEARLKAQGRWRTFNMDEVEKYNESALLATPAGRGLIVVDGFIYDISQHALTHKGWTCGCASSTLLAILRTLGTDCSEEVIHVHSAHALRQMQPYLVGRLKCCSLDEEEECILPPTT